MAGNCLLFDATSCEGEVLRMMVKKKAELPIFNVENVHKASTHDMLFVDNWKAQKLTSRSCYASRPSDQANLNVIFHAV
jgi:uncharacterized phosphosugar-binding protein